MAKFTKFSGYDEVFLLTSQDSDGLNALAVMNQLTDLVEKSQKKPFNNLLIFFAGHGLQLGGQNYLCFPEANIDQKSDMISVDSELLPKLRQIKANLKLVFLDTCRNEPLPSRTAISRGIFIDDEVLVTLGTGDLFVMYATKAGSVSLEESTGGFFTQTVIEVFSQSDQTLQGLSNYVRDQLPVKTLARFGIRQVPSIGGDFDPSGFVTPPNGQIPNLADLFEHLGNQKKLVQGKRLVLYH